MSDMFRMCGRDDQQGQVASDFIIDKLKAKRVVIIHDKDTYGQVWRMPPKPRWQTRCPGCDVRGVITRGKDFNALVTKIGAQKPDVVFFGGPRQALVRQMREQGVQAKFFSGDCIVNEEMVTAAGGPQYTNGIYMTFGKDPRLIPDGKAVIEKFRAGKFEPEGYTLYSYASVQAIAAAFKATGMASQRMAESQFRRYGDGQKAWDGKGDLKVSDYVVYQWDDKGKYKEVQ
jgi:branched-chain amino acid transport system substrate-binding protein